ncbi:hypothetical protein F511_28109 [Dorcoceras hygrometricum]|uniref:Uncharacterized protein n=1 Tax=Dorcoceras hygrometricum TaxID=472368 RepID=A0A2Z7CFS2_9LAMI|nr:hypothetical protein F511_28109 [Dorcoceras hygrometricum]
MRIRPPEFETSICDAKYHVSLNSSVLLVQPDEGVSVLVVDRIGDNLPQSTEKSRVLVIPVGARHKCQQVLLVQPDEGISVLVVDRIGDNLPQSTEKSRVLVIPVGARHKCQQDGYVKAETSKSKRL